MAQDTEEPAKPPRTQYVIISFDGAGPVAQWERSRALAARAGAKFTYFLSCVYLVAPEEKKIYTAPGHKPGRSNIGFAHNAAEIEPRLAEIWAARGEGHDIASHGCGHYDGKDWTKSDWVQEFDSFKTLLATAYERHAFAGEPEGWRDFAAHGIRGFRAPYLSTGDGLYEALAEEGFAYDASGVSRGPAMPSDEGGVVRFALPQIPEGPKNRRVIAMDYNLFVRHSGGFEQSDAEGVFEQRSVDAFKAAFDKQYRGERIPLEVGFHFTLMNHGAYWRALERFAGEACVKPGVVCTSYADYLKREGIAAPVTAGVGG
ncbi:MAG: polysaccharide deacetylase [Rhizobiaceae bacterium]